MQVSPEFQAGLYSNYFRSWLGLKWSSDCPRFTWGTFIFSEEEMQNINPGRSL